MFGQRLSAPGQFKQRQSRPGLLALTVLTSVALLTACGGDDKDEKKSTQVAAKVNKDEISVHQINFVLARQVGLKPEQKDQASKIILERLIDEELAYQQAEEQKVDRDPNVLQLLEAAKKELIVRSYYEKIAQNATRPTDAEIQQYYNSKPALFGERRIYSFQEIAIEAKPEQIPGIKEKIAQAKNLPEMQAILQAEGVRAGVNQAVRAAEQLAQQIPYEQVEKVHKLADGQFVVNDRPNGLSVLILAKSESQPVTLQQVKPFIEQTLTTERKRKLIEDEVKRLRAAGKIEYVGAFAPGPNASAPVGTVPDAASAVVAPASN